MINNQLKVANNNKKVSPITGYPNYTVSNYGDIKNTKTGRLIKPSWIDGSGLQVQLSKNGQQKNFYVHRLVAIHFLPNPKNLPEVMSKDGDKSNCHVDNLRFGDQQEERSMFYLVTSPDGKNEIIHNLNKYCRDNDLNSSHMTQVCLGNLNQHKGYKVQYVELEAIEQKQQEAENYNDATEITGAAIASSEFQRDIDQLRVKLDRLERVLLERGSYV